MCSCSPLFRLLIHMDSLMSIDRFLQLLAMESSYQKSMIDMETLTMVDGRHTVVLSCIQKPSCVILCFPSRAQHGGFRVTEQWVFDWHKGTYDLQNAYLQQRLVREVTIQYNLCNEPWYSPSVLPTLKFSLTYSTCGSCCKFFGIYLVDLWFCFCTHVLFAPPALYLHG